MALLTDRGFWVTVAGECLGRERNLTAEERAVLEKIYDDAAARSARLCHYIAEKRAGRRALAKMPLENWIAELVRGALLSGFEQIGKTPLCSKPGSSSCR